MGRRCERAAESLPGFITNLRIARAKGTKNGLLTPERIQALDRLGMIGVKVDYKWEDNCLVCAEYYMEHQDLNIPASYVSADDLKIGAWVCRHNEIRANGTTKIKLTPERRQRMDAIDMIRKTG